MYIMVVDSAKGYIAIEDKRDMVSDDMLRFSKQFHILSADFFVENGSKDPRVIPFGEIAISEYNQKLDLSSAIGQQASNSYQSEDFEILGYHDEFFNIDNSSTEIKDDDLLKALYKFSFSGTNYLKSAIFQAGKKHYQVFDVSDISELFYYDLSIIQEQKISIKQCIYCGHLFRTAPNQKYCKVCIDNGIREAAKREDRKNDIRKAKVDKMINAANAAKKRAEQRAENNPKGNDKNEAGFWGNYVPWLQNKENENLSEIEKWVNIDAKFREIHAFFRKQANQSHPDITQWKNERYKFPAELEHPEKWVSDWMTKIK